MSDKNKPKNHESNTKITAQNVEFSRRALYHRPFLTTPKGKWCSLGECCKCACDSTYIASTADVYHKVEENGCNRKSS